MVQVLVNVCLNSSPFVFVQSEDLFHFLLLFQVFAFLSALLAFLWPFPSSQLGSLFTPFSGFVFQTLLFIAFNLFLLGHIQSGLDTSLSK